MPSPQFEIAAHQLQRTTSLSRSQARGTVRRALKEAAVDPKTVNAAQMARACEQFMLPALVKLKIETAKRAIASINSALGDSDGRAAAPPASDSKAAFDGFARLASRDS